MSGSTIRTILYYKESYLLESQIQNLQQYEKTNVRRHGSVETVDQYGNPSRQRLYTHSVTWCCKTLRGSLSRSNKPQPPSWS